VRARDVTMVTLAAMVTTLAVLAMADTQSAPQPPPAVARDPTKPAEISATTPARSPRNASYAITARLDPASRTLKGEELVTWRNTSATPAASLRFHLYYNAWRNTRSTWMRELLLGGNERFADRPEADWGWIDITNLKLIGTSGAPADVTSSMRFIAPDDGNADDRTVVEVPLDTPVAPGETRNIQIAWSSRVPRTFARTGAIGNYYFLAQWFPKIGVFQDSGWNCHQFHWATEFFADFGIYDVRLTVPNGWVVGATGLERGRRDEGDGTTTHHYHAEDVHDFAWTTSPDYVERTARFGHQRLPPVAMRLLLQPEHVGQTERHFEATRATLKYYGEWYGPYPYPYITIVDPAWQSGADGMEYPTLFTAGTRWLAPRHVAEPEGVTVHEAGHQFWYGVVANNEFEHAWMDEGLNTFSTARTLDQFFQPNYYSKRYFGSFIPWVFKDLQLSRATDGNYLSGYRSSARGDAQATQSWRYWPDSAGAITYFKTALWLQTLERMLGWDVLQRILSTYYTRYAFRHPEPQDFFAVVNEVSRRDLTWFFDQVYRGSNVFDYGVDVFTSERVSDRGYFGDAGRQAYAAEEGSGDHYRTTVVVRRFGEGIFPVDVRVMFDNKQHVRWQWDGRERWKLFEVVTPARAITAQVDPERVLLLDVNYTNNSKSLEPRTKAAARKWSLVWLIWLQDHLLTYGFFI
jgi:Peptidase family M1 domain